MCAFFFAATLSCCSDRRKSFGPSAPIAYATSVSPPNEAAAWPGAAFLQITARTNPCSRHLWGTLARAVICRKETVALPGANYLSSRAQKPHFCVKTTKNLGKIAHSDTKMPILCSKGRKMGVPKPKSAQKCRFCARRSTEQHGAARRGREQSPETEQDRLGRSATARSTTKRNCHATQHNATHAT